MGNSLKPIETVYQGIKFRSKLEAQWAVFFDACGADWEYEPEGYDLGDGIWYLPDFLLHNVPVGEIDDELHRKWLLNGRQGIDPAENLNNRRIIKNLWVEVKGVLDSKSAKKIKKFANSLDNSSDIIMVGSFPKGDNLWKAGEEMYECLLDNGVDDCYFYELGASWTGYTNYLGADDTGTLGVYIDCDWTTRVGLDYEKTEDALFEARNYRFDHKK